MEVRKIAAPDRPSEQYRYRVMGSGVFPWDMLRYDCAYPASSEAVSAMAPPGQGPHVEQRTVELISYLGPTPGRWSSFGWLVVN